MCEILTKYLDTLTDVVASEKTYKTFYGRTITKTVTEYSMLDYCDPDRIAATRLHLENNKETPDWQILNRITQKVFILAEIDSDKLLRISSDISKYAQTASLSNINTSNMIDLLRDQPWFLVLVSMEYITL